MDSEGIWKNSSDHIMKRRIIPYQELNQKIIVILKILRNLFRIYQKILLGKLNKLWNKRIKYR